MIIEKKNIHPQTTEDVNNKKKKMYHIRKTATEYVHRRKPSDVINIKKYNWVCAYEKQKQKKTTQRQTQKQRTHIIEKKKYDADNI